MNQIPPRPAHQPDITLQTDILTLRLDPTSQAHFEALRQRHFPPERNLIPAHLTLFHTLPQTPEVAAALAAAAAEIPPFALQVTGLRSLGRGVAYTLASPPLLALHRHLSAAFDSCLTPQDRQKFQPHIVIQNKTTSEQARALLAKLQATFHPFSVEATGLDLCAYLNGPWQHRQVYLFKATATTTAS